MPLPLHGAPSLAQSSAPVVSIASELSWDIEWQPGPVYSRQKVSSLEFFYVLPKIDLSVLCSKFLLTVVNHLLLSFTYFMPTFLPSTVRSEIMLHDNAPVVEF